MNLWLIFVLAAIAIILAGNKLSFYGDLIALKTGLGKALVGSILIAGVTSLPELATISSATMIGAVDIAAGNVFGSNIFNLAMLAIMDLVQGSGPLMLEVHSKHILTALLGMLLATAAAIFILLNHFNFLNISIFWVGVGSLVIILIYLVGTRLNFRYEKYRLEEGDDSQRELAVDISLRRMAGYFIVAAVVIIISGYILSTTADQIAAVTGLRQSFLGTIMVAAATSLPEMVTVLSALRIGAYNMGAANVFGSNIFNVLILALADIIYRPGPIMRQISLTNVVTALLGLILSIIAVIGLFYRSHKTFFSLGWDSVAIIIIYLWGVYLIFRMGIVI